MLGVTERIMNKNKVVSFNEKIIKKTDSFIFQISVSLLWYQTIPLVQLIDWYKNSGVKIHKKNVWYFCDIRISVLVLNILFPVF